MRVIRWPTKYGRQSNWWWQARASGGAPGCVRCGSQGQLVGLWGVTDLQLSLMAPDITDPVTRPVRRTPAVNPGPGSYRLLAMLARLGVAGVEPLAHALGIGSTYSHLRRLERAGLVWRVAIGDGGGGAVAISRKGAAHVRDDELPAVAPKSQVASTGEHARAVSWIAADFELRAGCRWLGPAELRVDKAAWRVQRSDGAGHLPDLGVVKGDARMAIEVELHSKANDRLQSILRGYRWKIDTGSLTYVGYVTTKPAVARHVRRHGDAAFLGDRLQTITLDGVMTGVRRSVAKRATEEGRAVTIDERERPPLTGSQIMRAADVATLLHVPVSTVHDWARRGRLPSRKRGKHRFFIRAEVERWILSSD